MEKAQGGRSVWKADGGEEKKDRKKMQLLMRGNSILLAFFLLPWSMKDTKQLHQSLLNIDLFVCCFEPEAHPVIFL